MKKILPVSICIPAYNEGKNIRHLLVGLLHQKTEQIKINKIIVVSSGSTDKTDEIVEKIQQKHPQIILVKEKIRGGKASAINTFLQLVDDEVIVIESADTIPKPNTIENLCVPFLKDKKIGMTGGAPIPVNDPNCFLGYIIHSWWWFHRNIPRFGEIIAYRNIIPRLPVKILVDEAYIQAIIIKKKYKVVHIDSAVVANKGPETLKGLIKQRRKLFIGHANLHKREGVRISNMSKSSIKLLLFKREIYNFKELVWLVGGIIVEVYVRLLGAYDVYVAKSNPYIWDMATTTKDLNLELEEAI